MLASNGLLGSYAALSMFSNNLELQFTINERSKKSGFFHRRKGCCIDFLYVHPTVRQESSDFKPLTSPIKSCPCCEAMISQVLLSSLLNVKPLDNSDGNCENLFGYIYLVPISASIMCQN